MSEGGEGIFYLSTHCDEPERPEVRPGPDYQLLGFAQTGAEHTDTMGTDFIAQLRFSKHRRSERE